MPRRARAEGSVEAHLGRRSDGWAGKKQQHFSIYFYSYIYICIIISRLYVIYIMIYIYTVYGFIYSYFQFDAKDIFHDIYIYK